MPIHRINFERPGLKRPDEEINRFLAKAATLTRLDIELLLPGRYNLSLPRKEEPRIARTLHVHDERRATYFEIPQLAADAIPEEINADKATVTRTGGRSIYIPEDAAHHVI